ncbi:MAG: TlpA family protein disulfide reductase [Planctomycetota bacterium]
MQSHRRSGLGRMLCGLAVAGALGLGAPMLTGCSDAAQAQQKPEKTYPEIKAERFLNARGAEVSRAAFKGKKAVLIEFWATWCPPCVRSIPHLNELHEKHKDKLAIVGLSNEDLDTVKPFVNKMKMQYIVGAGSPTGGEFGVEYIPMAFLFDKEGALVWQGNPLEPGLDKAIALVTR